MRETGTSTMGSILVIRFSSLGDLVLMVPLLRALRDGYPEARLELLTRERYAGLFAHLSSIDELHLLEGDSLASLAGVALRLRRRRYELIVDAHDVIRSRLLTCALRYDRRVRLEKDQIKKTLLIKSGRNLYRETPSMVDRYLRIASGLGIPHPRRPVFIDVPPGAAGEAEKLLGSAGLTGSPLIAMAPGARWPVKRWPGEHYHRLARRLVASGMGIVLLGSEDERELCESIAGGDPAIFNSAGRTDIMGSAALLARCRCLVTNDSAPLHLAETVGTPVVAFFGPTVRQFGFYPRLERSILLERELGCRPCSRNGSAPCRTGGTECLALIGVDEAMAAVEKVLDSGKGSSPGAESSAR